MELLHGKAGRDTGCSKTVSLFQDWKSLGVKKKTCTQAGVGEEPTPGVEQLSGYRHRQDECQVIPFSSGSCITRHPYMQLFSPLSNQFRQEIVHGGCHVMPR